jgi:hypothetical protein
MASTLRIDSHVQTGTVLFSTISLGLLMAEAISEATDST